MALQAVAESGMVQIPRGAVAGTQKRRVLSAYSLSPELAKFGVQLQYIAPMSPALLQIRHAYLASPEIRQSIRKQEQGEVLNVAVGHADRKPRSMILRKGEIAVTIVSPVERFAYDQKSGLWQAEGRKQITKLPAGERWQAPDGDILWNEYGLPARTEADRSKATRLWKKALEHAGLPSEYTPELASYFWRRNEYTDFAAVYRYSDPGYGPWYLNADWDPDIGNDYVGVRAVSGLPSAEREAGPEKRSLPEGDIVRG